MCFISNFPPSLIESDGAPPDGTPAIVIHSFNIVLVAFCDVMAALGILFSTACLVLNFVFRNKKYVILQL